MQLYSAKPTARNGLGMALLATTIASLGAAALAFSPAMPSRSALITAAQAENLSEKVQQIPQRPVGFADIVEKVKPAVISVKVKIDRPADSDSSDQDLPFPPGSPFERFFKRFGMPNTPKDHEVITGQGSGFFISRDGYAVTNNEPFRAGFEINGLWPHLQNEKCGCENRTP
jgi:serine protease Do